jgi:hypothetical protein
MNEEWRLVTSSRAYQEYVVFVDSKSSRGRSKAEHLCQVRKLGAHHPERSLKQWPPHPRPPDRLPAAVYSAIFTVSNVNDS